MLMEIPTLSYALCDLTNSCGCRLQLEAGYKRLERTQTLVVALLLVSILVAAIACQPSILGLIKGLFVPTIQPTRIGYMSIIQTSPRHRLDEIVSYIGIIGVARPTSATLVSSGKSVGAFSKGNLSITIQPRGIHGD